VGTDAVTEARGDPRAPSDLLLARPAAPPPRPPFVARILPAAAAAATSILVGAAIVATRSLVGQTGPASLALWRYLIGTCCLLPPLLLFSPVRFARRDLVPIGLLGITQFGILIALLNFGLQFIPSARAALIFATMPLLTMLLSTALGHERLTPPKTLGVLLTIVGVGLALGEKVAGRDGTSGEWVGELAVFASALSGAVCAVLYQPYLRRYQALPVSAFAMLAAVAFLAAPAAGEGFFTSLPRFTAGGWLAVIFIGISSGIGYFLWLWALNHATPTRVTVFLSLSPVTATGLGAVFLAERISTVSLLGLGFVALGLWFAYRRSRKVPRPSLTDQASTRRFLRRSR
jgi:drug/metabolite transporter (DMT)-like permease